MITTRLRLGTATNHDAYSIVPGADRRISFDVRPISESGRLLRTVNGVLRNVGRPVYRKFRISISGEGRRAPEITGVFPGDRLRIELPEPIFAAAAPAGREIVERVAVFADKSQRVFSGDPPAGTISIGYRLALTCLVTDVSVSVSEFSKTYAWKMELEEE